MAFILNLFLVYKLVYFDIVIIIQICKSLILKNLRNLSRRLSMILLCHPLKIISGYLIFQDLMILSGTPMGNYLKLLIILKIGFKVSISKGSLFKYLKIKSTRHLFLLKSKAISKKLSSFMGILISSLLFKGGTKIKEPLLQ